MPQSENAHDLEIVCRIENGDTYEAIGNDCGFDRQRVQQIAERSGVCQLPADEKPLNEHDQLAARLLGSEPRLFCQEAAERCGLSQRQVRRIADREELAWMRRPVYLGHPALGL